MVSSCSGDIPIPESATSIQHAPSEASEALTTPSPRSYENFTAFVSRLRTICRTSRSSPNNGGIIAHLIGRHTETLTLRADAPRGLDRYAYELLPRVYRSLLALLFYRWEVIMRETAILGILGIATLGFYVDSAFAELRFDRAIFLIGVTALLNIAIDIASRRVRTYLRLRTALEGR